MNDNTNWNIWQCCWSISNRCFLNRTFFWGCIPAYASLQPSWSNDHFVCGPQTLPLLTTNTIGTRPYRSVIHNYSKLNMHFSWHEDQLFFWNICVILTSKLKLNARHCDLGCLMQRLLTVLGVSPSHPAFCPNALTMLSDILQLNIQLSPGAPVGSNNIISPSWSSGYFGFATAHGCTTSSFG